MNMIITLTRFAAAFMRLLPIAAIIIMLNAQGSARADYVQQGAALLDDLSSPNTREGQATALSADGNTLIIGGNTPDGIGAAWVFVRNAGNWSLQGKLVGTGAVGGAEQGGSVSLSDDGNTALIGGNFDSGGVGAAWVFKRSNGVWAQDGPKLVGSNAVGGNSHQGWSVSLSGDGNTAAIGGWGDNGSAGATWVFVRNGGVWSQQGAKLVGTGAVGNALQGHGVALSADGNTLFTSGDADNQGIGAGWVFIRSGGTWTQQGPKLVGSNVPVNTIEGYSATLSRDGNTALLGGLGISSIFTRNGTTWSQDGPNLSAQGNAIVSGWTSLSADGKTAFIGSAGDGGSIFTRTNNGWVKDPKNLFASDPGAGEQGMSVSLSADAKTAVVGGPGSNNSHGAAWVFVKAASVPHDFNADSKSDILWRANTGDVAMWFMNGTTLQSGSGIGAIDPNWQIVKVPTGGSDFDGDGKADILWHHANGSVAIWLMNGATITSGAGLGTVDTAWQIAGVGDFNGDGKADILWRHTSGAYAIWFMNGSSIASSAGIGSVDPTWQIAAINDLNGDGKADIVLRNTNTGDVAVWLMNGASIASGAGLGVLPSAWQIVGTGDFNGDGMADILWRHTSGSLAMWFMNGAGLASSATVGAIDTAWNVASTGDYDGDSKADILWRSASGDVAIWLMNGASIAAGQGLGVLPLAWSIVQ